MARCSSSKLLSVHTGDYIKLQPPFCELKYGQLLSIIKSETGHTSCLVQGFELMVLPDGRPLLHLFDCPLYNLSRTIFSVVRRVSMVHRCGSSCQCWICSEH
eukprot:Em0006g552a